MLKNVLVFSTVAALVAIDCRTAAAAAPSHILHIFHCFSISCFDHSPYEAMKGVTSTAARTFEMEHEIGLIKEGKQATCTILNQNFFKIDPVGIKDISVFGEVYKDRIIRNRAKPVGGDRSAHNCIGSAGFSWCTTTEKCERPWQLAEQEGFADTRAAFDAFCRN